MASDMERPRITEIQVRMDCNGCVQKIKRALHGINGIYDLYIDLPQQKITIVGCADPEKIVKAIKKTRKSAIICSHTEPTEEPPAQPAEPPAPKGGATPPDSANPPPAEAAPQGEEAASPGEPPKSPLPPPPPPPPPAQPQPPQEAANKPPSPEAAKPSTESADAAAKHPAEPTRPRDVEEVHVIYHYPPDYGYRYNNNNYGNNINHGGYGGHTSSYPSGPSFKPEPPPPLYSNNISHGGYGGHTPPPLFSNNMISHGYGGHTPPPLYANHSYNTHRPSPYVTQYEYIRPEPPTPPQYATTHSYNTHRPSPNVTQYEYIRPPPPPPPPPPQYTHYSRPVPYSEDFHYYNNGNITSVFSDENPNACTIV